MKLAFFAFIGIMALGCASGNNDNNASKPLASLLTPLPVNSDSIKGIYSGNFKASPISVVLHYVSGRHVSGYDIHKGLKRNIAGTMLVTGTQVQLNLAEPGTNPNDGTFKIIIDTVKKDITGWWTANNDKSNVVHFTLTKRKQKDNDFNWILIDSLQNSIQLNQDGSCNYSYLAGDSTNTAQQFTVNGNYTIEKDSVLNIFWENNTVFPSKKSTYTIHFTTVDESDGYKIKSITLEDGRVFSELYD